VTNFSVGDMIRHADVPTGICDVEILEIKPCEPGDHPSFKIKDPETRKLDWVCSLEFAKVDFYDEVDYLRVWVKTT
jgi:hypothetical protein